MNRAHDVIIIGAGIVGTACARSLAGAGMDVLIVDAHTVGSGATAAGMGHIVIMDDSPAQLELTRYSQKLWEDLFPTLPSDCEVDHCGTLWVAADDEEMEEVHRKQQLYQSLGLEAEALNDDGLSKWEPQLRRGLAGGLRIPGDSVIYPPCAARRLLEEAEAAGATSTFGAVVKEISGTEVVLRDDTRISAKAIINATGSWAPKLTPGLPVHPKKGHLLITARHPGFLRHQILELGYLKSAHGAEKTSVAFNVQPRKTGQLLIGSSRQLDVSSKDVEPDLLQKMLARAVGYLPELASTTAVRAWTGIRAATPDSLPLIGPHPSVEGLYLATGHEGLGITTSMATAELITEHLTGKPCAIDASPYLPSRFQGES